MTRGARAVAAVAILFGIAIPTQQVSQNMLVARAASQSTGLAVQAVINTPHVVEGGRASLFVHSGALTSLTLTVQYTPTAPAQTYRGVTDPTGRYVFSWAVPLGQHLAGTATLQVKATRGTLQGSWKGDVVVKPAPLPPLFVQPLASHFTAGTTLGVFVSTTPGAELSYHLVTDDGKVLARGGGQAGADGRYVINEPDRYLPRASVGVTATVSVTQPAGTRIRTAHFLLTPRPPLGLYVASTSQAVRAGETVGVFVSSVPGTHLSVTVALTSTVVAHGTGIADKHGRWVYTTALNLVLKHAMTAHVVVQASHGIDQTSGRTTFLLRPGPINLGLLDRLANTSNPAPNLGAYFTQIPDKVIMVSTEGQTLREYEHGVLVHENYVTTGRPELPTVHGIFHVYAKVTPFQFISPWPAGSPFWYPPSWVRYWMPFIGGYGLHDAPWRKVYGPGTNLPHYDSDPGEPVGSHGCVNIPLSDMIWLWNWAPIGTPVVVY